MKFLKILMLGFLPIILHASELTAGKDYVLLSTPKTTASDKALVQEFFSFGCPWCYKLQQGVHDFALKNKNRLELEPIPVVFHKEWEVYAKAFYVLKAMDKTSLAPKIFKAIQDDKKNLTTEDAMVAFLVEQGLDKALVQSGMSQSPSIGMQVSQGMQLMASYGIQAVPAFVVNGRYKTDLQMAGSEKHLFEILDQLVKM